MTNPIRHYRSWTSSENRQLRELARLKTSAYRMSLKLGRTADAIRAQAAKQGISLRPIQQIKLKNSLRHHSN